VFEVFTAVYSRIPVSWDMTPRRWAKSRRHIPEDRPECSCSEILTKREYDGV
jgi:hypothetical protein